MIQVQPCTHPNWRDNSKLKCDHYGKIGHIKEKCFKFFGYPTNWGSKRNQRKDSNKQGGSQSTNFAQVEKKRDSVEGSTIGHVLHETRTKIQEIHFANMSGKIHVNHTWIIDSGASHHTIHLPFILQSIKKLEKPFQIITPIRTSTLVDNMGDVIK